MEKQFFRWMAGLGATQPHLALLLDLQHHPHSSILFSKEPCWHHQVVLVYIREHLHVRPDAGVRERERERAKMHICSPC